MSFSSHNYDQIKAISYSAPRNKQNKIQGENRSYGKQKS